MVMATAQLLAPRASRQVRVQLQIDLRHKFAADAELVYDSTEKVAGCSCNVSTHKCNARIVNTRKMHGWLQRSQQPHSATSMSEELVHSSGSLDWASRRAHARCDEWPQVSASTPR